MEVWSTILSILLVVLSGMHDVVESRIFVSYNRANTITYTSYRRSTYNQSNTRLMWIFVGFFFGSVILVLLCFFCYIKCRRKQPPAERNAAGSNMTSPGPRYDIDPPRYTPTVEGGHHTLKPSEGPLPPRYSDIIDAAEGSLPSQDTPGHSTEQPSSVSQGNSEGTGTRPQGAASSVGGSEEQEHTVTRDSDGRKLEKNTPTHDKAGLIDNEVENSDE